MTKLILYKITVFVFARILFLVAMIPLFIIFLFTGLYSIATLGEMMGALGKVFGKPINTDKKEQCKHPVTKIVKRNGIEQRRCTTCKKYLPK